MQGRACKLQAKAKRKAYHNLALVAVIPQQILKYLIVSMERSLYPQKLSNPGVSCFGFPIIRFIEIQSQQWPNCYHKCNEDGIASEPLWIRNPKAVNSFGGSHGFRTTVCGSSDKSNNDGIRALV
jgi:hypothetical protein